MKKIDPPSRKSYYYVISNNFECVECVSFDEALATANVQYILKNNETTIPYLPKTSDIVYNNTDSYFEIFDNEGAKLDFIEANGWRFEFLRFGRWQSYSVSHFWVQFTDRKNNIISNDDEKYRLTPDGFIKAIRRFNELIEYDDYQFAVLSIKLTTIEKKLKSAEDRIKKLEKQVL